MTCLRTRSCRMTFTRLCCSAAWRQRAPVADELRAIWLQHLAAATEPSERVAAVYVLLELRAYPELLPVLRGLAEKDPRQWLSAYGEAATAAGRQADLPAFWTEMAMRSALPTELRRQLAFRVLESGDKRRAEQVFQALAFAAPPQSPDVRMMLFIWGPRPSTEQLDWVEARARRAAGAEAAEWMKVLIADGAPARAVAAYRATAAWGNIGATCRCLCNRPRGPWRPRGAGRSDPGAAAARRVGEPPAPARPARRGRGQCGAGAEGPREDGAGRRRQPRRAAQARRAGHSAREPPRASGIWRPSWRPLAATMRP